MDTAWLYADRHNAVLDPETVAALGEGPIITLHERADEYGLREECPVTSEQVIRWQAAERAYRAALDEMRAAHAEAAALTNAIEQVTEEAEDALYAEVERDRAVTDLMAEAEADERDGPREWLPYERTRTVVTRRGDRRLFDGYTFHHRDCPALPEHAQRERVGKTLLLRLPEAVRRHADEEQSAWRFGHTPPKVCKRCATRLAAALAGEDD